MQLNRLLDDLGPKTFVGPSADDAETLARVPQELRDLLVLANGFVAFRGGLHFRGACLEPSWHSLGAVTSGPSALSRQFRALSSLDVPFAQDCVGDQFILRGGGVSRLACETDELTPLGLGLFEFLAACVRDPDGVLSLSPLQQFEAAGSRLEPGQLLNVYPPFCTAEAANGVSLAAVPAPERIALLAAFARQIREVADGDKVRVRLS